MRALATRFAVPLVAMVACLAVSVRPADAGVHIDISIGLRRPVIVRPVVVQPAVVRSVVVQTVPAVVTTTAYSVPTYTYSQPVVVQTVPVVVQPQVIVVRTAPVVYTTISYPRVVVRAPLPRPAVGRFRPSITRTAWDRRDTHDRRDKRDRRDHDRAPRRR